LEEVVVGAIDVGDTAGTFFSARAAARVVERTNDSVVPRIVEPGRPSMHAVSP
jgi:hypothetical protein